MLSGLTDALEGLGAPLRALGVALLGAWWASLWFTDHRVLVLVVMAAPLLIGLLLDWVGRKVVGPGRPVWKIRFMEWWILVPVVLAGVAGAVAIVTTVELVLPDTVPEATKETVGAVGTAITAFLSAGFIDWAADGDDSKLSDRIRDHFYDAYKTTLKPGTVAERYVYSGNYSGADGWGRSRTPNPRSRSRHPLADRPNMTTRILGSRANPDSVNQWRSFGRPLIWVTCNPLIDASILQSICPNDVVWVRPVLR